HLWVQDVQNRVFSTLGQPNWLAAYLIALTPITLAFSVQYLAFRKNAKSVFLKAISYLLATLFFLVLLFTRSRSGLLGFVVADVIFWGLVFARSHLAKQGETFKNAWHLPFGIFHLAFGIVLFLNGTNIAQLDKYFALPLWHERLLKTKTTAPVVPNYQAPLLEAGGTESGTIRKYVWQGAINAWKSTTKTMALGTGTETFAFAFYRFKPPEHNLTSEWDFLYNKAHNEYLNYLATTGIFGLGSYLLFIGAFIIWFVKSNQQNKTQSFYPLSAIHYALFAGWISVLITNFFGFSVVMMQLFFFLFPAMVFLLSPQFMIHDSKFKLTIPSWTVWLPIIGGLYILVKIGSFWYADTLFARGYRLAKLEQYSAAQERLARAVKLNPREPLYRDEIATTLAALTEVALESKNATAAAALARQSLIESDLALTASPNNVNFWKSRTKIYYTFSSFDPEFLPAAITALKKALSLSPTDPKILYNLAVLYGRQDDNQQAIETLKTAISLKPNYRDAYFALYIFYNEVKQPQLARAVLTEYLTKVDPNDQDFRERLQ
ncbi:MAG: tetratricopeptide repeat protein, partial [Patescibacteria group bacterium]